MNNLRNQVTLIGRLGATPELKTFESGAKKVTLNLATNESYKDKNGEWIQNTQWHNVYAWGKSAERIASTLAKGQEICISGKLVNSQFETKTGEKRYKTEIEALGFLNLSSTSTADLQTKQV